MINENFSIGRLAIRVLRDLPSFRFRDKNKFIHNASEATKCSRQITYKAKGYVESNPTDNLGLIRMNFGNWTEAGLKYSILAKLNLFGVVMLGSQGDAGEHDTFYGTSWHGYRDFDIGLKQANGTWKPVIVELKTKIGYGAQVTLKKSPWSKEFVIPTPDTEWGYSQQLGLYLRNAYQKTLNNPSYAEPIKDGILIQLLYADGIACFVEYFFEYQPEIDSVKCYRVHCEEFPQCSSNLNLVVPLKPIAEKWAKIDACLAKDELAPPDFERKYNVQDTRVTEATKKDLELAIKSKTLIGDVQCKYCSFRDQCAKDLGIDLTYSPEEVKILKQTLKFK